MSREEFLRIAQSAGFDREQASFLWNNLSRQGHEHTADQIQDLDEALEGILEERD